MTHEDDLKYEEERAKAIEEWSDIELRLKDGAGTLTSQGSMDGEKTRLEGGVSENKGQEVCVEEIFNNDLWKRIFQANYTTAREEARKEMVDVSSIASTSNPFSGLLFLRQCVCRPSYDSVETVKNARLREQRELLLALANTPFTAASIDHWRLLCDFFRRAATAAIGDTAQAAHCPRTGPHWQIVGFQGADPSTDLRGVGLLGLLQLHYLVSEWGMPEEQVAMILRFSQDESQNFPFAVVGLNFTSLIVTRLKSGELNGLANVSNSFLDTINGIYRGCFIAFYRDWKVTGKSIIDFQSALNKIDKALTRDASALLNMKWVEDTQPGE